jgi:hypothetical protein
MRERDFTGVLGAASDGDHEAAGALYELVHRDLHCIAHQPSLLRHALGAGDPVTGQVARCQPSLRALVELFLHICAAVEFAHRHLRVHRDLTRLHRRDRHRRL